MEHPYHTDSVRAHLERIYQTVDEDATKRVRDAESLRLWQAEARPRLRTLIGLDTIEASRGTHTPRVELGEAEGFDGYTRQACVIETEPGFRLPFWFLRPEGSGPFPLAVTPHGHDPYGPDSSVGLAHDEEHRAKIEQEDRDVAVQAVRRGFAAIAPAARGTSSTCIPDINGRHGNSNCRSELIHALLAGRTAMGERVWDVMRLIDWADGQDDIDTGTVLVVGNSGGGVITLYTAAVDERITVAIPSCSYCTIVGETGLVHHCDCNTVPGVERFGEVWDIAALIAPRRLLVVNGREDSLFPIREVERAIERLAQIYRRAGAADLLRHEYGPEGHRLYADLMWPFVERAIDSR